MASSQGTNPEKPRKTAGNGAGRGSAQESGGRVFQNSPTGSAQDIHRTPPQSVEAEQGVLGSMLIAPQEAIPECVEKIKEEYFYVPAHQTVFEVLVEQWNNGQAIDLITFTQTLRDKNVLETIGGASFVTSLFTFVPTAANLDYYLEIVRTNMFCARLSPPALKECVALMRNKAKLGPCSTK
jgi:replicative DNA helicase